MGTRGETPVGSTPHDRRCTISPGSVGDHVGTKARGPRPQHHPCPFDRTTRQILDDPGKHDAPRLEHDIDPLPLSGRDLQTHPGAQTRLTGQKTGGARGHSNPARGDVGELVVAIRAALDAVGFLDRHRKVDDVRPCAHPCPFDTGPFDVDHATEQRRARGKRRDRVHLQCPPQLELLARIPLWKRRRWFRGPRRGTHRPADAEQQHGDDRERSSNLHRQTTAHHTRQQCTEHPSPRRRLMTELALGGPLESPPKRVDPRVGCLFD